jgi:hypothetical protein
MDQVFGWFKELYLIAPVPAVAIAAVWVYFKWKKDASTKVIETKANKVDQYVAREECHAHIDGLKEDINSRFTEIKMDIRELRDLIFNMVKSEK